MKPGSIVVVLPFKNTISEKYIPYVKWLPNDNEKDEYMIKAVYPNQDCVTFEEHCIGHYKGRELAVHLQFVRELLPPFDIQEVTKITEKDFVFV